MADQGQGTAPALQARATACPEPVAAVRVRASATAQRAERIASAAAICREAEVATGTHLEAAQEITTDQARGRVVVAVRRAWALGAAVASGEAAVADVDNWNRISATQTEERR